ncbi:MAG: transposase [Pseudomonas sp.]|nr:transposase [Pseudomonas sp.]
MARSVNFVWNFVNELSQRSIKERGVFLSAYDMHPYTKGAGKELGLHSQALQFIAGEYVTRRRDSYGLSQHRFRSGSFSEDARGRWYFNIVVDVEVETPKGQDHIGIDLGLTDTATCSDGFKLEAGRFYRGLEDKLATAQRAGNKIQVRTIHAKIANRRKDALHKFSRTLVNRCGEIYVGNVSRLKLVKTKMVKSVLDAGWGQLKTMLDYKCAHAGIVFKDVNEAYTTQTCSNCGSLPESRPKGIAGLGIREWTCSGCGVAHDRDTNAVRNILAVGHGRLAVGIPLL